MSPYDYLYTVSTIEGEKVANICHIMIIVARGKDPG